MKLDPLELSGLQKNICDRIGTVCEVTGIEMKVGVSDGLLTGEKPIHGLRHQISGDTSGWYLWAGETQSVPQADDYFKPLHVSHLLGVCPEIVQYLGLPPGYRFVLDEGYEDVWNDPTLLDAS